MPVRVQPNSCHFRDHEDVEVEVLPVRHTASRVPLDSSLVWLPFEIDALERPTPVDSGGVWLRVAEVADLLV